MYIQTLNTQKQAAVHRGKDLSLVRKFQNPHQDIAADELSTDSANVSYTECM